MSVTARHCTVTKRWDTRCGTDAFSYGTGRQPVEGAEVTCSGRLFQTRAAATGKARSPTADSRVCVHRAQRGATKSTFITRLRKKQPGKEQSKPMEAK